MDNAPPVRGDDVVSAAAMTTTPPSSSTSSSSPSTITTTCPSCGMANASFSKNQSRKRYADRKCKSCVGRLANTMTPRPSAKKRKGGGLCTATTGGDTGNDYDDREKTTTASRPLLIDGRVLANNNDDENELAKATVSKYFRKGGGEAAASISGSCCVDGPPAACKRGKRYSNDCDDGLLEEDAPKVKKRRHKSKGSNDHHYDDDDDSEVKNDRDDDDDATNHHMQSDEEEEYDEDNNRPREDTQLPIMVGGSSRPQRRQVYHDETSECLVDTPSAMTDTRRVPRKTNRNGIRTRMENDRRAKMAISSSSNGSSSEQHDNQSLEAIKRRILGRSVSSMYDVDDMEEATMSKCNTNQSHTSLSKDSTFANAADRLKQELSCPICHDRMYQPVSLHCGHSFCQSCLGWWLERQQQRGTQQIINGGTCPTCREPLPSSDMRNDDNNGHDKPTICVNTALKAVLDMMYPHEMNQRRVAEERQRRKARGGEMGGFHDGGCEEIEGLEEEDELAFLGRDEVGASGNNTYRDEENGWISLYSKSNRPGWRRGGGTYNRGSGSTIAIRRNIILDENDRRYRLSLGLTRCAYHYSNEKKNVGSHCGVLDVELCLLAMEEDEVDDSGFPILVEDGEDDEALICTGGDRVDTCIECSVRVVPASALTKKEEEGSSSSAVFGRPRNVEGGDGGGDEGSTKVREVPLSRGMIGRDGSARFRIDLRRALLNLEGSSVSSVTVDGGGGGGDTDGSSLVPVKLRFRHVDTGAILELRLPAENDSTDCGEMIEFGASSKHRSAPDGEDDPSRFLLDDRDLEDEDMEEGNEYEEDDFLVNKTQSESEEDEFGSCDDEHDIDDEDDGGDDDGDDGECEVCGNGGDLIVCDGGDHEGGCGKMYHVICIGRDAVPPGDWICNACALKVGIDVGIEGHEYEVDEKAEEREAAECSKPLMVADSDDEDDEMVPVRKNKGIKRNILDVHSDDNDDDGDDYGTMPVQRKNGTKGKILDVHSDDDDDDDELVLVQNNNKTKGKIFDVHSNDDEDDDEMVPVQKIKARKGTILDIRSDDDEIVPFHKNKGTKRRILDVGSDESDSDS